MSAPRRISARITLQVPGPAHLAARAGLDNPAPFGAGPAATPAAIEHLGYVQIDTIHVIERCHHHILYARIPSYHRDHLYQAQSIDKTVFEYWTHALAYVPVGDLPFYVRDMKGYGQHSDSWFTTVKEADVRRVVRRIRRHGALTIRDIDDDVLVEKDHAWASRKPSKRALQLAFYKGLVTVSARTGMLKTYQLTHRHFGWKRLPRAATEKEKRVHLLDRALRSQGLVSLESVCFMNAPLKPAMKRLIEARVRRQEMIAVDIAGAAKWPHWTLPQTLADSANTGLGANAGTLDARVHILSPFDPLIIQRKRLQLFFDYEHRFEAYVPRDRRVLGYFACPVLVGEEIVAAIDLKADRVQRKLRVQQWTWVGKGSAPAHRRDIETALHRFETFQLAK